MAGAQESKQQAIARQLMRACVAALLLCSVAIGLTLTAAWAQTTITFPALTGRVSDTANILSADAIQRIAAKLAAHEAKTSDQIVVATVPTLQGLEIEDYANRLYRHWKLGNKDKNNGALLLVAPRDKKLRIEVGYGLEGALTDALSKSIIATIIAPKFRAGDFSGGVEAGVDGMLALAARDADEWQRIAKPQPAQDAWASSVVFVVFLIIFIIIMVQFMRAARGQGGRWHRTSSGNWVMVPGSTGNTWGSGSSSWSSGSSSGGFSGGFSGGGGSSGGGGASGDW
jgi:uncharacterized protein